MSDVAANGGPTLSVIVPTLNEEQSIADTLDALSRMPGEVEVIVADGGSDDRTVEIARQLGVKVVAGERGRGAQMNSGARVARGETLLFLHADTIVPIDAVTRIREALEHDDGIAGGNFSIRFEGESRPARFMTWLYPKLARLGLRYGDSGIFVRTRVYKEMGGFKPFPLFEDVDFIRRLRKQGSMVQLPLAVVTSSRRFQGRSFTFTFARWSILQVLYWLGVPPQTLSRLYAPRRTHCMNHDSSMMKAR